MEKFKEDNYITIQGWMISRLKLKSNSLILFALLYGFTQDGETEFSGSRKYMCAALQCTYPTVDKALKELIDKGLVIKKQNNVRGVIFNHYKVSLQGVKKLYRGCKETLQGGSKETLHYNTKIDNTRDKKKENNKKKISNNFQLNKELKLATKLSKIIQSRKKVNHTKTQLKKWAVEINRLKKSGVKLKHQKEVMKWYANAIGGEYIPVVESGAAWREKFSKLENAIERESKTNTSKNNRTTGYRRKDGHKYKEYDTTI